MGFLDDALGKAEDLAQKNPDKVKDGIEKAKDVISDKTGGKYDDKVDAAADKLTDKLGLE
ncbi:antitoxin [Nocardioides sp.]|jgi:hypothetical protein|uniref:antitoxin n=1 Tax=Nocardioides sp. TaxID=35761 RepID=UPI0026203032|nr:antitoxin [Nocardioides sp.]